jgi:hypothetical protein
LCGKILANGSVNPAKLKEHLRSVHPENASKNALFFFVRRMLNSKKLGHFQNLDLPFHKKNLFLKHPIKLLTGPPNKKAPHYWRNFSKAMCTGNGRARLWTGTEEKTWKRFPSRMM